MLQEKRGYLTVMLITVIASIAFFYLFGFMMDSLQQGIDTKLNEVLESITLDIPLSI